MAFEDALGDEDHAHIMETLGNSGVTYSIAGVDTDIDAMVEYGGLDSRMLDSATTGQSITLTALKTALPGIKAGSRFKHNGIKLIADKQLDDDGTYLVWAMRYG